MKMSSRGRVTIPKHLRERFGLAPGTKVDFIDLPDGVKIVKRLSPFARYKGYLKDRWVYGDIDEYLRDSRGRD